MFSAYLAVYNDWDILAPALRSIAPYIDELVVVDGAYAWMAPYLSAHGHDLLRSDQRVYDAIESSGIPYRVISRLWRDEVEKRIAGYSECGGRYACRIDADEVLFFNDRELERFMSRGGAVAWVDLANFVAPGWIAAPVFRPGLKAILRRLRPRLSRQCFLFDRRRVDPAIHLNYLWLVGAEDSLPRRGEKPFPVHRRSIGFNAHLAFWRALPTKVYRAEWYTLNQLLRTGVPWLPQLRGQPLESLSALLELVPAPIFRETIESSRFKVKEMVRSELALARPPISSAQLAVFDEYFAPMLESFAALNRKRTQSPQHFVRGQPLLVDVSDGVCIAAVAPDGLMVVEFERNVVSANVELHTLAPRRPWYNTADLEHRIQGPFLVVRMPPPDSNGEFLRRQITLRVQTRSNQPLHTFRIRTERPLPFTAFE